MVKRRTDSDSEEEEKPSVGLKRARIVDSDDGEEDGDFEILSNLQNNGKNKGKARNVSFNEEDQYAEEDAEAEEENRFEQEHRESILAGLEEKRKVHGVRIFKFHYCPMLICAPRELQTMVSSNQSKCINSCATNFSRSPLVPRSTLSSVSMFLY